MKETDKVTDQILDKLITSTRSPRGQYSMEATRPMLEKRIAAWHRRRFLRIASSVAAVVLLGTLLWGVYLYTATVEVLTVSTLAETKQVQLPDGSQVTLNRYTTLSYPEKFKKKNREVSLQGEAYFAVSKDPGHPFIVQTDAVDVRVLGTEFNVEAYPKDELVKTSLFEGSVAVDVEDTSLILAPNESITYNKTTGQMLKETFAHTVGELPWQRGTFVFANVSLKEIVRQLSNAFNVDIRIADPQLEQYRMTGRFVHSETLDDILLLLQGVAHFTINRENEVIHIQSNSLKP